MFINLLKWFQGYLLVIIKGYSPERFLNLCRNKDILIWNLHRTKDGFEFCVSLNGFKALRPIVRKTKTRPFILKRFGFPFMIHKYRKRKAFFFGILLSISIVYILSLFIWDITIEGQSEHTEEAMLKYLKEIEVYAGAKKGLLDCHEIEEKIRLKYTDIGWVSAEIKGTRLHIKLVETNMPVPYEVMKEPSHLVASHDGTITSIVTRQGTPMVKKGDVVKKGDILISGVLDIIGDGDLVVKKEAVIADGDIFLETNYNYEDNVTLSYIDKEYKKESKNIYGISVLGKKIFITNPINTLKADVKYDIILNEKNFCFSKSFVLPFSFIHKECKRYEEVKKTYSNEEAKKILNEKFQVYIHKLMEKGVSILENHVTIKSGSSKMVAKGILKVQEKVTEYRKIEENEWRAMDTDELSGDNH